MARILIVDDDAADRIVLRAFLERAGHETVFADHGESALREHSGQAIDVIITDLQMPKMHGLELITLLRDLSPRPAIIAISGTGASQLDLAAAVGADETLSKPVDPGALLNAVTKALSGRA